MKRAVAAAGVFVVLAVITVFVFQAFDRGSHSASDTLRPFLITVGPVWFTVAVATWVALRRRQP